MRGRGVGHAVAIGVFVSSLVALFLPARFAFADSCCVSCLYQVRPTACSAQRSPQACAAIQDCRWNAFSGTCYSWFEDYCDTRVPQVERHQLRSSCRTAKAAWVYRPESETQSRVNRRPPTTAGLAGCDRFFMIYSGHGPVDNYYATFLRELKTSNPNAKEIIIEDSSCRSMENFGEVKASLNRDESLRPPEGASYRIWGNQLVSSDFYSSYLGIEITPYGINDRLWPCDLGNPCERSRSTPGSPGGPGATRAERPKTMWCLLDRRPVRLSCCADNQWRESCEPSPYRYAYRSPSAFQSWTKGGVSSGSDPVERWLGAERRQESLPATRWPGSPLPKWAYPYASHRFWPYGYRSFPRYPYRRWSR